MLYRILGKAKIGQTPFDGTVYVDFDIDGSIELRPSVDNAYTINQREVALALAQFLTTHHSSQLSFTIEEFPE